MLCNSSDFDFESIKGSECKHKCKDGYGLHRMSPAARTCVCTKWGCVWMRKVFKLIFQTQLFDWPRASSSPHQFENLFF